MKNDDNGLPLISIIIPVYNGSNYLSQAIDSALSQSYKNMEIIVINDGSNDDGKTESLALSYGNKIRYFSKSNGGVASALNLGIKHMLGQYFSWLSHDDLYLPNKLETELNSIISQDNRKVIAYSDFSIFWDETGIEHEVRLPNVPADQFRGFLTLDSMLHGCTLLIPKAAFDVCGKFNEALRTTQDYDLWFRMAELYDFIHVPEVLIRSRQHTGQGTSMMKDIVRKECNMLHIHFVDHLSSNEIHMATHRAELCLGYTDIAVRFFQRRLFAASRHAGLLAVRTYPASSFRNVLKSVVILTRTLIGSAAWGLARGLARNLMSSSTRASVRRSIQNLTMRLLR